jgi:hypothetical protein
MWSLVVFNLLGATLQLEGEGSSIVWGHEKATLRASCGMSAPRVVAVHPSAIDVTSLGENNHTLQLANVAPSCSSGKPTT